MFFLNSAVVFYPEAISNILVSKMSTRVTARTDRRILINKIVTYSRWDIKPKLDLRVPLFSMNRFVISRGRRGDVF